MSVYRHYLVLADQHEVGITCLRAHTCEVMETDYWYQYTSNHAPSWVSLSAKEKMAFENTIYPVETFYILFQNLCTSEYM